MEDAVKAAVVTKCVPEGDDMALINAQALRELRTDEVFVFRIAAADSQVDRDFERFTPKCLERMAQMYVGKTVIADHRWSSETQCARVFGAAVETDGSGVSRLILRCYTLRSKDSQPLIDAIEAGIVREVSVGLAVRRAVCSICGVERTASSCGHRPGRTYDGKMCVVELDEPSDVYEVSFVAVPAQREAGVVKAYGGETHRDGAHREALRLRLLRARAAQKDRIRMDTENKGGDR